MSQRGGKASGDRFKDARSTGRGRHSGGRVGDGIQNSSRPNHQNINHSSSIERFLLSTVQPCSYRDIPGMLKKYEHKWDECWQKVGELSKAALRALLNCIARIPPSCTHVKPPLIESCHSAVSVFVAHVRKTPISAEVEDERLEAARIIINVVKRLLQYEWNREKLDIKNALVSILSDADSLLLPRLSDHRKTRDEIGGFFEEIDKPWTIKVVEVHQNFSGSQMLMSDIISQVPTSWRHPTVQWLSNYQNFQPCALPKMKIPGSLGNGVYESPTEYFDIILSLWTAMTFVDGNNALLPHCTYRDDIKTCEHVLLPLNINHNIARDFVCRTHNCSEPAAFGCPNNSHVKGLCHPCAMKQQSSLRGPPGKSASTHIYDGTITKINYDGELFIADLQSRRPPEHEIHWKTTRRLACANLVGIVRIENRFSSLRLSDGIVWAQVHAHGDSYDEWKYRKEQKLMLSILSGREIPDVETVANNPPYGFNFCIDENVAIIDCQTFVPEFIPVLAALEGQKMQRLPFHDGTLLNINGTNRIGYMQDYSGIRDNETENKIRVSKVEQSSLQANINNQPTSTFELVSCGESMNDEATAESEFMLCGMGMKGETMCKVNLSSFVANAKNDSSTFDIDLITTRSLSNGGGSGLDNDPLLNKPCLNLDYDHILRQVRNAINESALDPVVQIRRSDQLGETLVRQLSDLIRKATLDDGQLNSFLRSLLHPVHCTQGPPGTGTLFSLVLLTLVLWNDYYSRVRVKRYSFVRVYLGNKLLTQVNHIWVLLS